MVTGGVIDGAAMRILIEPGSYRCQNMGDVAMLQTAVRRLRALLPGAELGVFTGDAVRLAECCPEARPVATGGRALWFADRRWLAAASCAALPGRGERRQRRHGQVRRLALSLALAVRGRSRRPLDEFLSALRDADLFLACGQGSMGDATASHAMTVLDTLDLAARAGVPTAMLGQGIGPLSEPRLRARAAAVLPRVHLIALREGKSGLPLLRALGVDPERILVTGDDAIELAYGAGAVREGSGLGVNIRLSGNAGVDGRVIGELRGALEGFAADHAVELVPVPIARGQARDAAVLRESLARVGDGGGELASPEAVIAQLARCRILVTGAYHAAVFALSRGVPVIGLAGSDYYRRKFEGLADQFGAGCELIALDEPDFGAPLRRAMEAAWAAAPDLRPGLRLAAHDQIGRGWAAYRQVAALAAVRHRPASGLVGTP